MLKRVQQMALLFGAMIALSACTRAVRWEEEVVLNTGETIVVKRKGTYTYQGLTSDGQHFTYVPEPQTTIEFTYKEKRYSHSGHGQLQLIAVDAKGLPNLVARPSDEWTKQNKYSCDPPYYVQFRPSPNGNDWTWPERIEPWLYKLPTNLVLGLAEIEDDGKTFTANDQQDKNGSAYRYAHNKFIEPTHFYDACIRTN